VFDRFDQDSLQVFDTAVAEAHHLDHHWVGTEHLLLALVQTPDLLPPTVAELLPPVAEVQATLDAQLHHPPAPDAELLATLGIDLVAVRTTVRETFGADAVDSVTQRRVHQPWQPWRRPSRRCRSLLGGQVSVSPRAKEAFAHAAQGASGQGRTEIDPTGLLLGILEVEGARATSLLLASGAEPADIRRALIDARRNPDNTRD
jgi:ATP-dependent Clp protease ATP-binding subunit ClpA